MNYAEPIEHCDYLDVRDIIARVETLESDIAGFEDQNGSEIDDEREELAELMTLLNSLKGMGGDEQWRGDWYPITLIHSDYFVEAMEELVKDIGDMPRDLPGYLVIDWDATAENLRADYSSVPFLGTEYWYR